MTESDTAHSVIWRENNHNLAKASDGTLLWRWVYLNQLRREINNFSDPAMFTLELLSKIVSIQGPLILYPRICSKENNYDLVQGIKSWDVNNVVNASFFGNIAVQSKNVTRH